MKDIDMTKLLVTCVAAAALLAGCASVSVGTGDQNPEMFTANETVVVTNAKLTPEQRKALDDYMKQADYHGAFVINPLRGSWHWFDNTASVVAATAMATGACEYRTGGVGSCMVYAVTYPTTPDGRRGTSVGISERGAEQIREMIGRTNRGNYSVLAQTQLGVSRTSTNYPDLSEARADALERCNESITNYRREFQPQEWDAMTKNLSTTCQIAWTYQRPL